MNPDGRTTRFFPVSVHFLAEILKGKNVRAFTIEDPFPDDAVIESLRWEGPPEAGVAILTVSSAEWVTDRQPKATTNHAPPEGTAISDIVRAIRAAYGSETMRAELLCYQVTGMYAALRQTLEHLGAARWTQTQRGVDSSARLAQSIAAVIGTDSAG